MTGHIIVAGSINMDLVVKAPRHPLPGETILGSAFHTFPGGKGANQAAAAARLGGQVRMIGRVGDDVFGEQMLATLQTEGVDTRYVARTEHTANGVALITVSEAGQNNIVVVPGANARLSATDIRAAEALFDGASVLLMQLEIPLEAVEEAARLAARHGVRVLLNPAPAQALPASLLAQVDYLIPNEYELALLTGVAEPHLAASAAAGLGIGCLIVTLGSQGVLVSQGGQSARILPHAVNVVDTTAAGDAFVGAFGLALTQGLDTLTAAAWGNAAGALAVTKAGAQPSLPTRADLDAFMQANPARIEK